MALEEWQTRILADLTPQLARLTILVDPDDLLSEETLNEAVRARGFGLLRYEEPVSFRYSYEKDYYARWEAGDEVALALIVANEETYEDLPYDVLQAGRKLSYSLPDFFPEFYYPLLAGLDRADLSLLYRAYQQSRPPRPLGQLATADYLLKYVFGADPEQLGSPTRLLSFLLQHHYARRYLPTPLAERLTQKLRGQAGLESWPLPQIIEQREAFLAFLQAEWPSFVEEWLTDQQLTLDEADQRRLAEGKVPYQATGFNLPFADPAIRVYMDNYFIEGLLTPLEISQSPLRSVEPTGPLWWLGAGLRENRLVRLETLLARLAETLPRTDPAANSYARYSDWLAFAYRWAELRLLHNQLGSVRFEADFKRLEERLDQSFQEWLLQRYAGLASLFAVRPIMLHHVPRFLAAQLRQPDTKVVLLVLDGLALDQWRLLHATLVRQKPQWRFQQEAVFAWTPTLTAVSRQALFAGKAPALFAQSLDHTNKEGQLWQQYWQDNFDFNPPAVIYRRNLGQANDLTELAVALEHPSVRVAGLVVNTVDNILHGAVLGMAGVYSQVQEWADQGYLTALLDLLLSHNFKVYLTSDHGNIAAVGMGAPGEGRLAEVRGERVRIYSDEALRSATHQRFPTSLAWSPGGLPADYLPLFAPGRQAFTTVGEQLVGHGGLSLEELIVPFVEISGK